MISNSEVTGDNLFEQPATRRFAFKVLILCGLLTAIEGIDIYIVASALPVLAEVFDAGPQQFALIFTVQAIGQVLGSYFVAPLADRYGRRPVIIWSVMGFGVLTLACALTTSVIWLAVLRFFSLILIGAAQPNLFTAASEFAAPSQRHRFLLAIGAIHALGAGLAAVLTAWLLDYSWNAPFVLFGALSVLSAAVAALWLPETIAFLARQGERRQADLNALIARIGISSIDLAVLNRDHKVAPQKVPVAHLFSAERRRSTLWLWLCAACSLPLLSTIGQWLPTFLHSYGQLDLKVAAAMTSASAIPAALWPIALALIMDRLGVARGLALNFLCGAVCMLSFAWIDTYPLMGWFVGLTFGAFVAGSVTGVYALAAQTYPVEMRVTGMGWAIGAGRVIATLIPLMGGRALANGASALSVAMVVSVLLSVAALAALQLASARRSAS